MVPTVCVIIAGSVGSIGVVMFSMALRVVPVVVPVEVPEAWAEGVSILHVVHVVPRVVSGFSSGSLLCEGSSVLRQSLAN